jgi:aconitate hydratase
MMRGTFANIRIRNEMVKGKEGGYTKHIPSGEIMSIYDAAMKYKEEGTSLVVIGGKEYGTGSSRDWAAKGTLLLGVKAVITESFERIHRSNLIGMGVLPLEFIDEINRESLGLDGSELVSLKQKGDLAPGMKFEAEFKKENGQVEKAVLLSRIDTADELKYFKNGGILQYVLRNIQSKK